MIVSRTLIKKPRKVHNCASCRCRIYGPHIRLYGCAEKGDPLYVIRICVDCDEQDGLTKERKRLQ